MLETLPDNGKRPYNSSSDEESEELHASRDDEDAGDTDRSAFKEASDARKKEKSQDLKKQAKVRLVTKGSYCTDITNQDITTHRI